MAMHDEGYEVPIHRSIIEPTIYWMGVPRNLLLLLFLGAVLGGIIFKTFLVPVLAVIAYFIFRYLGTQDKQFMDVFLRSRKHDPYYYR